MRSILSLLLAGISLPAMGDTYTGVVSDVKHFHNGGIAVDLDGHWPSEKMALFVPPADAAAVGALPSEGAKGDGTRDDRPISRQAGDQDPPGFPVALVDLGSDRVPDVV
jgi:hypothetical protein